MVTIPSPSHRPQVGRFGTYYPKTYTRYKQDCKKTLSELWDAQKPISFPIAVVVETIVQRPKKTERQMPRGDFDNYAKGPLDSATSAGVWVDDDLIADGLSLKRYTNPGEEPGVVIYFAEYKEAL